MTAELKTVRVCAEDDLEVGEARRFDLDDHRIAVVRGEDFELVARYRRRMQPCRLLVDRGRS